MMKRPVMGDILILIIVVQLTVKTDTAPIPKN
jgi:hypothetical protein